MNLPDTQFGVQSFWRKTPRPRAEVAFQRVQDMPVPPALASAHERTYVDGFVVSFSVQVSNRVDVAAPALAGSAAPPRVMSGAANRTAPSTAVARDKFFFMLPSFCVRLRSATLCPGAKGIYQVFGETDTRPIRKPLRRRVTPLDVTRWVVAFRARPKSGVKGVPQAMVALPRGRKRAKDCPDSRSR